jgi:signal transduction histidine kinase
MLIFIAGGIITYRVMKREIDFEQERFLVERLAEVERYIQRRMPDDTVYRQKLIIIPLKKMSGPTDPVFSDTLVTHSALERIEPHLKLQVNREVNGKAYQIIIFDVIVESDDIVDGVVESLLILYGILIFTTIFFGMIASYFVLKPFRNTLEFIKGFSLKNTLHTPVKVPHSKLPEQQKLNDFLDVMIKKIITDFKSLKEFSENASHAIKTPLAIIQGKLDLMLNDEELTQSQVENLTSIQGTVRRLSKLSDALVLLTKIDNKEFTRQENVDISLKLNQIIDEFSELIDLKSIKLYKKIDNEVKVKSDPTLIEVMLSNLIINAIKYNWEKGEIYIALSQDELIIKNTGNDLVVDSEELFKRFKKSNQSESSMGLGLAIVKKICDFSGFSISYLQKDKQHTITLSLRGAN